MRSARLRSPSWALAALLALSLTSQSDAQSTDVVLPPTLIVTNYDSILIGQDQSLESGAYVARADDASANWYNPAGLANVDRSIISAAGTGYVLSQLSLTGSNKSGTSNTDLGQLPSYVGAVLGREVLGESRWRLGISIAQPNAWGQSVGNLDLPEAPRPSRVNYNTSARFSTQVWSLAAGWSPLSPLRVGASVGIGITDLNSSQSLAATATVSDPVAVLRTLEARGQAWQLRTSVGAQWDILSGLTAGAQLRFPSLTFASSGSATYQDIANNGSPWSQAYFRDTSAAFAYQFPFEVDGGLAWSRGPYAVEVDVRYHASTSSYNLLSSTQPVTIVSTVGGQPVQSTQPFPNVSYAARSVVNFAVGGHWAPWPKVSIHGGVFTDHSPAPGESTSAVRQLDIYGATLGAKWTGINVSGSVGLFYSWGSSVPFDITGPGQPPATATIDYKSIALLYALSYQF
jgi:hypothetical protein